MAVKKGDKWANHEVFKILSAEFDLDMGLVEQVMGSQSLLTKKLISSPDLVQVRWPNFGKFQADKFRVSKVNTRAGMPKIKVNKDVKDTGEDLLDELYN